MAEVPRRYPPHPLVGVGALVVDGDKVLVVKRENEPGKGLWSIPGGLLELGELMRDGAKRETREETGIEVEVGDLLDVVDNVARDENGLVRYHYVLVDFLAHPIGGKLKADTDVKEVMWVPLKDIGKFPTTRTLRRLLDGVARKR